MTITGPRMTLRHDGGYCDRYRLIDARGRIVAFGPIDDIAKKVAERYPTAIIDWPDGYEPGVTETIAP